MVLGLWVTIALLIRSILSFMPVENFRHIGETQRNLAYGTVPASTTHNLYITNTQISELDSPHTSPTKHLPVKIDHAGRSKLGQIDTGGYNKVSKIPKLVERDLLTAHSSLDDKDTIGPAPSAAEATNHETSNAVSIETKDEDEREDDEKKKDDDKECIAGDVTQLPI